MLAGTRYSGIMSSTAIKDFLVIAVEEAVMNRIASERNMKNLTQVQLAAELGVSETTIVRWEKGGSVSQNELVKMRNIFHCDLDWLLGLSDERRSVA